MTDLEASCLYGSIMFYVGKKTIVLNEHTYTLGELTADILNISPENYRGMKEILLRAEEKMEQYRSTKALEHWEAANDEMLVLDGMLCAYPLFRCVKQKPCLLKEASTMLYELQCGQLDCFDDWEDDESYDVGNLDYKWMAYEKYCRTYHSILDDLASFNQTIRFFIRYYLSALKKLDPENYAAALYDYLNDPRAAMKMIANPIEGTGVYSVADPVMLRFVPRPVNGKEDTYQIFEYYEATQLQTLLKMDFYKALSAGHVIRRCEYCGRYFLLTKGYHTKYCDKPNPQYPEFTCAQLGYRQTGLKEAAKDDPMKQALFRCYQRLNKDVSRKKITKEERDRLYALAVDLHFDARQDPNISFEEFDASLATENLCALCGIQRENGQVGRPKKS